MMLIFWGLAIAMTGIAIAVITIPLAGLSVPHSMASKPRQPGRRRKFPSRTLHFYPAIAIPLLSLSLYTYLGSPGNVGASTLRPDGEQLMQSGGISRQPNKSVPSVGSLVGGLRDRLQREADDADGWLLLARSFHFLGRYDEAVSAYDRARALGSSDKSLEQSLKTGRTASARAAESSAPSLRGRVVLTTEAAARVNHDDTVFIFAKKSRDDRMPVVALRRRAADLPIDFVLTDEQAMVPGTHLADFETLVVTARISRSGFAMDVIDGLEVWSDPIKPDAGSDIELLIGTDSGHGVRGHE